MDGSVVAWKQKLRGQNRILLIPKSDKVPSHFTHEMMG